ncbi:MAG: hypothetical protein GXZ08_09505 [Tissierellia bacterium]|nr:hypothetical protein [Tissierellia bacterium]
MNKMKKVLTLILATFLIVGLVGCGLKTSKEESNTDPTEEIVEKTPEEVGEELAETPQEEYAEENFRLVQENWPHMDSIWPELDYNNHNFLLFYNDGEKTPEGWVINAEKIEKLSEDVIKSLEIPQVRAYNQLEFEGKPSIAISFNDELMNPVDEGTGNFTYDLATHELIHFYHQEDLKSPEGNVESRAASYPLDPTPRIYRGMVLKSLVDAYDNPEQRDEYLGIAKYWSNIWESEFPTEKETIAATEVSEGAPRYIETLGEVANPDITTEVRDERIRIHLDYFLKEIPESRLDSEPYAIGAVSGLLLDEINPDWKNDYFINNKAPIDILLGNIEPLESKMDDEIKDSIEKNVNDKNTAVKPKFDAFDEIMNNKKVPVVILNEEFANGAFIMEGSYNYKGYEITVETTGGFTVDGKPFNIDKALMFYEAKPDSNITVGIIGDYSFEDSILKVDNEYLKCEIPATKTEDADGRIVFTMGK